MTMSEPLRRLIETAAPLFAGEAEVVHTYWDSPVRTVETDLRWLELQVFKEFKGSGVGELDNRGVIMGPLAEVADLLPRMDLEAEVSRHRIRELLEGHGRRVTSALRWIFLRPCAPRVPGPSPTSR